MQVINIISETNGGAREGHWLSPASVRMTSSGAQRLLEEEEEGGGVRELQLSGGESRRRSRCVSPLLPPPHCSLPPSESQTSVRRGQSQGAGFPERGAAPGPGGLTSGTPAPRPLPTYLSRCRRRRFGGRNWRLKRCGCLPRCSSCRCFAPRRLPPPQSQWGLQQLNGCRLAALPFAALALPSLGFGRVGVGSLLVRQIQSGWLSRSGWSVRTGRRCPAAPLIASAAAECSAGSRTRAFPSNGATARGTPMLRAGRQGGRRRRRRRRRRRAAKAFSGPEMVRTSKNP